ncbi:MAG: hypothetical protein ACE5E9_02150 [Nitrospinaceae bacterium]
MRGEKTLFFGALIFFVIGFAFTCSASQGFLGSEDSSTEAVVLHPGMAISCQNDFVVENLDNTEIELKVILGNEEFLNDRIEGKKAKAYGLRHSLSSAKMQGMNVTQDDIATVINTDDQAKVRFYCME